MYYTFAQWNMTWINYRKTPRKQNTDHMVYAKDIRRVVFSRVHNKILMSSDNQTTSLFLFIKILQYMHVTEAGVDFL